MPTIFYIFFVHVLPPPLIFSPKFPFPLYHHHLLSSSSHLLFTFRFLCTLFLFPRLFLSSFLSVSSLLLRSSRISSFISKIFPLAPPPPPLPFYLFFFIFPLTLSSSFLIISHRPPFSHFPFFLAPATSLRPPYPLLDFPVCLLFFFFSDLLERIIHHSLVSAPPSIYSFFFVPLIPSAPRNSEIFLPLPLSRWFSALRFFISLLIVCLASSHSLMTLLFLIV